MAAAVSESAEASTSHPSSITDLDTKKLASASVVVVSIPACPYCKRAKEALSTAGVPYVDLNVLEDATLRSAVKDISGQRTVPQIFVGERSIGGSDDLAAALANGSFNEMLKAAKAAGKPALPSVLLEQVELAQGAVKTKAASGHTDTSDNPHYEFMLGVATRMAAADTGVPRTDLQIGQRVFRAFTGEQAVWWLRQGTTQAGDFTEQEAAGVAQRLLDANLMTELTAQMPRTSAPFRTTSSYALVSEVPCLAQGAPLNTAYWWYGPARPAQQVAAELRGLILQLYDKHLSADGTSVNYGKMRADPLCKRYVAATAELQKVDLTPLNREELMAMFINLYNALIVHALCEGGTRMTALQRSKFFTGSKYLIGGLEYSADDMENGVLRGNRSPAADLFNLVGLTQFSRPIFRKGDPRTNKVVTPLDPRIHFALVCGAKSCPPIKLYSADSLEEGLAAAGEAFCQSGVQVDKAAREVKLSKIFKWYSVDFGRNDRERLTWVLPFLQGQQRADLAALLSEGGSIKVSYMHYDWGLNGEDEQK